MIGIDVVGIERVRGLLATTRLAQRAFSATERSYCEQKVDPALHYAGTLAAKEAVIKALRLGRLPAWARSIEIRRADGIPVAVVAHNGEAHEIPVSITHDAGVAIAVAYAVAGAPRSVT